MVKEVLTTENEILHRPTEFLKNEEFGPELETIVKNMFETMENHSALGLAANQIGINKSILVLKNGPVMINPTILAASGHVFSYGEGCLSVPGKRFDVKRKRTIVIRYLDLDGKECRWKSKTKMQAIAIQHEMDHLAGITIEDQGKLIEE